MTTQEAKEHIKLAFPKEPDHAIEEAIYWAGDRLMNDDEPLFWMRVKEYMKRISRKPYAIK